MRRSAAGLADCMVMTDESQSTKSSKKRLHEHVEMIAKLGDNDSGRWRAYQCIHVHEFEGRTFSMTMFVCRSPRNDHIEPPKFNHE